MFIGAAMKKVSLVGYVKNNLFEIDPDSIFNRHEVLKMEMIKRFMNHKSELPVKESIKQILDYIQDVKLRATRIDSNRSLNDLITRCPRCYERFCTINPRRVSDLPSELLDPSSL